MKTRRMFEYEAPKAYDLVQPLVFGADGGDSAGPGDGGGDVGLPDIPDIE